jgi:hypothetical protein
MTVAVITIVTSVSAATMSTVLGNLANARRANAREGAHATAEAGADEYFARVVRDPAYFANSKPGGSPPYLTPGTIDAGYTPNWATFVHGAPVACVNPFADICFQVEVTVESQPGNFYADAVNLRVTAVTLCPHGFNDLTACVAETVNQRLTQRQYFDYLYFDELETLDPILYPSATGEQQAASRCQVLAPARNADCVTVPFLGGDNVYGPIHTNDQSFADCRNPTFQPPVGRDGWPQTKSIVPDQTPLESAGAAVLLPARASACANSQPQEASRVAESPNAAYYSFATDVTSLAAIADRADSYRGTTTITLHGGTTPGVGTYSAEAGADPPASSPTAWPGGGVIYVDGDVYISGQACDPISIAATGDIFVDGDLTYGPPTDCPSAATGLEANDSVVVLPTNGPSGLPVNATSDRRIEAAVLALGKHSCYANTLPPAPGVTCGVTPAGALRGGSFYVQGWATTPLPPGATPHYLHFLGSIATIWRGAVGAFDSASGLLRSGWAKDFAFDRVLRTSQPPYFLAPVGAGWARTDLAGIGP